ncbi:MAG: hypothetical protein OEY38_04915 [Gammaproteobacteria bacterium]|nr:hypothetical protein [Gammaproteobacteria bacterium]
MGLLKKNTVKNTVLVSVVLHDEAISCIKISLEEALPSVEFWDYRTLDPVSGVLQDLLGQLAKDHSLKNACLSTLLAQDSYQIKQTEAPPVPLENLNEALQWQVNDLFDWEPESVVVDSIPFPEDVSSKDQDQAIYVLAAKKIDVQSLVEIFSTSKLKLAFIDVPELAQRNLATLCEQEHHGVALISFSMHSCLLTISKLGMLYMTRRFDIGLDKLSDKENMMQHYERIVIEIQRSLDFYSANLHQAPVKALYILPLQVQIPGFVDYVKSNLFIDVAILDLSDRLSWKTEPMSLPQQALSIMAIGAGLRLWVDGS